VPSYTYSRYTCEEYHEQYYISCLEEVGNGLSIYNLRHFAYEVATSERDIGYFRRLLELNPDRALQNDDPKVYDNRPSLLNFEKRNERLSASAYIETQALLQLLFSRFIKSSAISQINTGSELNDMISFIGEYLHEELTVARLAEFCHLSPDHFSRVFRKKFGLRPSVYLQSKRVERAQLLLLTTNDSLAEIAEKTGWGNLSYFSRIFKKTTGKTPGTFRKERLEV
jgi:AraC-like DNA-binding protein